MPSTAGKLSQHLNKAGLWKETWSAPKCPGRVAALNLDLKSTVDQPQQITWLPESTLTVETLFWTSGTLDCVSHLSTFRLWDIGFQ